MAFFQLVLNARKVRKAKRIYEDEKLHSIAISKGGKVHYTLAQRIRHRKLLFKRKLVNALKKSVCLSETSWLHRKVVLLRTDGSLENYVVKSFCGFLCGVFLTYLFFVFFVFQLSFGLLSATLLCTVIGWILTLGLAFSPRIRCVTFLFLPQFFSKRGRQVLMAYAFILALTGPAKNTLHNMAVLSESLACGQELLKEAVKEVLDMIKQPFYALKESLAKIIKSIKAIIKKVKKVLVAIKRIVLSILRVIKAVFDWLGSIVNLCNAKLGTPYERCRRVFDDALADCQAKLGPVVGTVCGLTKVAGAVCYALKPLDLICMMVSYVSDAIVGEVRRHLKKFTEEVRAMFYVKVKFSHSFEMKTNKSRSIGEISSAVTKEIKKRTGRIFSIFDWASFVTSFFILFLILKVIRYRHKWLTSDRFDNHYISRYMHDIDFKRARQDKETIFPLNARERTRYVSLSSALLIAPEKRRLAKSAIFLGLSCVKLATYIAIDYCLWWLLSTIRYHARVDTKIQRPKFTNSVEVKGKGFIAEIYRSIARAFAPYDGPGSEVDVIPCLPAPKPPDYDVYMRILIIALLCWIMAFFEPYGLRIRHTVLNSYYPDRAKQRAVWLYNQIIRSRGSFLKYARRQLRRKFGLAHEEAIERVTLRERIWALCPWLSRIVPLKLRNTCLVCGQPERDRSAPHVRCPTPGCVGIYCPQCFQDLHKLCTICKSPLDYGDLTDFSEERDSSEVEVDTSHLEELRKKMKDNREGLATSDYEETKEGKPVTVQERSDDDTSSKYSYSYQDEDEHADSFAPVRTSFKDVEAQEIRDDVTMQIFHEPVSSSSDEQLFCFGYAKRKKALLICTDDRDKVTSIADTESWPTEVIDEDQDSPLEIEDFSGDGKSGDELLPKVKKERKKGSGFKGIFRAFNKIFTFNKKKEKQERSFKKRNKKDSIKTGEDLDESSTSANDENYELVDLSKSVDRSTLRKRSNVSLKTSEESETRFSVANNSRGSSHLSSSASKNYYHVHSIKFKTKEIPRHLKMVCSNTKYFEIDESSSCNSPRESLQIQAGYFSAFTESQTSADSDPSRERRSTTSDIDDNDSYIYTSENNDNRYNSKSETSDSSYVEDFNFSGMSTDVSDEKESLRIYERRYPNNDANLNEEDKINADSDEKGQSRRMKPGKEKLFDPLAGFELYDEMDNGSRKPTKKRNKEEYSREAKEAFDKTRKNKGDILKKGKVEKETANAKRKSLPFVFDNNIEKVNKAVDANEFDIDDGQKYLDKKRKRRGIITVRHSGGSDDRCSRRRPSNDQKRFVHGFQPILLRTSGSEGEIKSDECEGSRIHAEESNFLGTSEIRTRDQGTYVRLKHKKGLPEENDNVRAICECTDDS